MDKRRIFGVLALAVITAVTAGVASPQMAAQRQETAEYQAPLEAAPVAQVEGETLSPNGRFQVRTAGKSEMYVSGYVVPEFLQIVDTETGELLWQDQGALWQSARWSPANNLVAIAYGGRTWTQVKVISTACWISLDFTLPDGSPIPEYEFLPEDWGTWPDMDTLLLTVGRGGDAGEPHTYRCTVRMNQDGTLSGSALEQTTEVLSEDYDFDHDGMPETTELVPETDYYPAWYILQVIRQDGVELWSAGAHPSHAGWTSVFACKIDGEDYLLQYEPEMYQGWAEYAYELWAFDGNGQAYTSDNRSVTFDINFGREEHPFGQHGKRGVPDWYSGAGAAELYIQRSAVPGQPGGHGGLGPAAGGGAGRCIAEQAGVLPPVFMNFQIRPSNLRPLQRHREQRDRRERHAGISGNHGDSG